MRGELEMLTPGMLLGERYEIIEKIGSGGMSIVYKAKDRRLQRYVAIKELREEYVQDEEFVSKFRREALSAASLSYPNIVGIYDVGNEQEIHYIVMEYVEGKTLKQWIEEEGPFAPKVVLELGIQIVSALKHAHQKKIIHRDIKPQNILVTPEGVLKVTDFGIAKAVDSSTIVATSNAIGSVHYFSPEQAKGKYVNESSDLYSCGIVLFELATKCLPYESDSHITIALKHINDEFPKPSTINPEIPENLENIILRATCKNQANRYQDADEMLRDMNGVLKNPYYKVVVPNNLLEQTILLSDEEIQLLRNSENTQETSQEEKTETEKSNYKSSEPTKSIYKAQPKLEDDDNGEEVSMLYKIIVSAGGVLATLTLVIILTLACAFWIPSLTQEKLYSVPNVVDLTYVEAETLLRKSHLGISVVSVETDKVATGTIIRQDPLAGTTVKKNTPVEIQVAIEKVVEDEPEEILPEEVDVPNLSALTINEVTNLLNENHLTIGKVTYEYHPSAKLGEVIDQNPSYGTSVAVGSEVALVISKGQKEVETQIITPNLYGYTVAEAKVALNGMKLSLGKQTEAESSEPVGTIIDQSIESGSTIAAGTKINVVVSSGIKEPEIIEEPTEPVEPPVEETMPDETPTEPVEPEAPVLTTQSISVNLPSDIAVKDNYHVVAKLTLDNGTSSTQEMEVAKDSFPVTFNFEGTGTGIVNIFIDGTSTSQDTIIF